ncbi:MAG TPA: response regulator, partial [Candidatus Sulfotelmatobacter sp.]|nr:response regulator [Candidatus Sulfotelmatobacter sp.]
MAKILVADDNSNIQKMVGLALKDQGIDVVAVGNGEAAVRKISDVHPDLVLADVFMPVRNGYEVCRYVKEDSALSHIPVILLVGAFDPLDEQEAQRVGADGVLKKPFVPPDPLISMVKSALTRAGVPLGPASSTEKPTPPTSRTGADILGGGVSSKLAALSAEKLPEAMPEAVEEFPAPPPQVKIPEGQGPVAFGSLLDSTETEEESVFSSKPMINLAADRNWDEEPNEVPEEEDEEESARGGWRPGGLDEEVVHAADTSASVPDWRDEAFHGSSPAKSNSSHHWAPPPEQEHILEAAQSPAVAVSTLETKPTNGSAPFTSDAWAAAMAAGVEEKLAEAKVISEEEPVIAPREIPAEELPGTVAASLESSGKGAAPASKEVKATEPGNWAVVPESSWEAEAKRASMLASTWDAAPTPTTEETQEVSAYVAEQPEVHTEHSESPLAENPVSAYSGHWQGESETAAPMEASTQEAVAEPPAEVSLPKSGENAWELPATEVAPPVIEEA